MTNTLALAGRYLFAIAVAAFGIDYLLHGHFATGHPPAPGYTPGAPWTAYLLGAYLVLAALGIVTGVAARRCALALGVLFFLCVVLLHGFQFMGIVLHGGARTEAFEALAFGCEAFILAALLPGRPSAAIDRLALVARFVFALSLIVFGVQHFLYAGYIATLVTAWIPGHLFLVYLSGVGFIAAGIAIAINVQARLAATAIGAMLLLWVLVLHLPRAIAAWSNGDEWSSLFVALGIGGGSLVVARWMSKARQTTRSAGVSES